MKTTTRLLRLGSATMLLALTAMLLLPTVALALSGIFAGGITLNVRGGVNTDYPVANFNGTNLGSIGCGQTLVFVGGYVDTYKNGGSNVTGASINYRVYPQGSASGSYTNLNAPFRCNKGSDECSTFSNDGDQRWRKSDGATDIAAGLGPGTYTIEVYSQAASSDGTLYLSNGGANYKATFSVLVRTTSGTGTWDSGSTWTGGTTPAPNADVEICSGSTVSLTTDPTVRSVKILGALQDDSTANTLTIAGTATANPSFTNNGTFTAESGTVAFEGQNNINGRVWGSAATTFNNVTISANGSGVFGVDFYDQDATAVRATINGTLTLNTRTFVANEEQGRNNATACANRDCGAPFYGASSTLKYSVGYPENEGGARPAVDAFQAYGEWIPGNTTGSQPGVPNNVQVTNDSWVSFKVNVGSYRLLGNFTIDAGVDGNTYGGAGTTPAGFEQNGFNLGDLGTSTLTLAAGKDVTNNGTLKQSGTPSSGTTSFVSIKDANGATLYYGIDITNGSALGATTVKVNGNQAACPYWPPPDHAPIVKRCYYIEPPSSGSGGTAQVTFYYEYAELNGLPPDLLNVWKDNGNGTWTGIDASSTSACTSGSISCSVTVNALSLVAGANRFVLSPTEPTAVTLTNLAAAVQGDAIEVTWDTVSEVDHLGFNVYRAADAAGPGVRLNAGLIRSQGPGSPRGFHYSYLDAADLVAGTTYTYWLEDVSTTGAATRHAPVSVRFGGEPNAVRMTAFGATGGGAWPAVGLLLAALGAAAGARRRKDEGGRMKDEG